MKPPASGQQLEQPQAGSYCVQQLSHPAPSQPQPGSIQLSTPQEVSRPQDASNPQAGPETTLPIGQSQTVSQPQEVSKAHESQPAVETKLT